MDDRHAAGGRRVGLPFVWRNRRTWRACRSPRRLAVRTTTRAGLAIESLDRMGGARTLFDDGIVDRLVEALAVDERRAPVTIDVPENLTSTLRIRQTGHGAAWWSIHELTVWERRH